MNLLLRWRGMIETSIEAILRHAKKKGKIKEIPENAVHKIESVKNLFKDDKNFQDVIELYSMLRKLEKLKQDRKGEFRKNVTLTLHYQGKEIEINLDKLKEYSDMLEKFISTTKQFLLS